MLITLLFLMICGTLQAGEAALSAKDQADIMEFLCEGTLSKDRDGLVCKLEKGEGDEFNRFTELRWSAALQGRWRERDQEWLVSLSGMCISGCPKMSYVLTRKDGRWVKEAESEGGISGGCIRIQGFTDGLDRAACTDVAGPNQGFMMEWLDVQSFAKDAESALQLAYTEQGGECFFAQPPETAEYRDDHIFDLTPGDPKSEIAFTAVLELRRLEKCDSTIEDPEKRATVKARHKLKFLRRGNAVVADTATKAILDQAGWSSR